MAAGIAARSPILFHTLRHLLAVISVHKLPSPPFSRGSQGRNRRSFAQPLKADNRFIDHGPLLVKVFDNFLNFHLYEMPKLFLIEQYLSFDT